MTHLAIFASGNGSNAEVLARYFAKSHDISVDLILSNKSDAGVLRRAKNLNISSMVFSKSELEEGLVEKELKKKNIDFIILAGFLLKIPDNLVRAFENRMINIHPSLLPKYGGKGMYGDRVHRAVIAAGENMSGISIHLVNEVYDDGKILFQKSVEVTPEDTAESLAEKIHLIEHKHFPEEIEKYIKGFS
jgi:phosphoribosylglycinamide formyltransferase-1